MLPGQAVLAVKQLGVPPYFGRLRQSWQHAHCTSDTWHGEKPMSCKHCARLQRACGLDRQLLPVG